MITYRIELRTSFDSKDQEEAMRTAVRMAAKHMLSTAALVAPHGRPPEVRIWSDDFFEGKDEIELADDLE